MYNPGLAIGGKEASLCLRVGGNPKPPASRTQAAPVEQGTTVLTNSAAVNIYNLRIGTPWVHQDLSSLLIDSFSHLFMISNWLH